VIVTSHKVPDDIDQGGHRSGKDFLIERNAKPYIDCVIFEHLIHHHHLPHIMVLRTIPCHSKPEAVLLMDNCSVQVTPEIFRLLGENHIRTVTLTPRAINIFQALSISFFGVFKTKEKFWMDQDDNQTFAATTHTLVCQCHSAATPENIHGNFILAGFL
jgi:hypothetical protein